jgi:hypothetical protein
VLNYYKLISLCNKVNENKTLRQSVVVIVDWLELIKKFIIIIISLLKFLLLGHRPSLWITHKENHNPPHGPGQGLQMQPGPTA